MDLLARYSVAVAEHGLNADPAQVRAMQALARVARELVHGLRHGGSPAF